MEPIKLDQNEIVKAVQSGNHYIQVGKKKFLLMEVDEVCESKKYIVKDPDEKKQIIRAIKKNTPKLNDEQIEKLLNN